MFNSLVWIVAKASGDDGLKPSGSKPSSPATAFGFKPPILHLVAILLASIKPIAPVTTNQKNGKEDV